MVLARELLPNFDCSKCTKQLKKVRGCDAPPQQPITFNGEVLQQCPMRPFLDNPRNYNELFLLYRWYRSKLLPDAGTVLDQAGKALSYYIVIDAALADAEKQLNERRQREAKKQTATQNQTPKRPTGYRGKSSRGKRR